MSKKAVIYCGGEVCHILSTDKGEKAFKELITTSKRSLRERYPRQKIKIKYI